MLQAKLTCTLQKLGDDFGDALVYSEVEVLEKVMSDAFDLARSNAGWLSGRIVISLINGLGDEVLESSSVEDDDSFASAIGIDWGGDAGSASS